MKYLAKVTHKNIKVLWDENFKMLKILKRTENIGKHAFFINLRDSFAKISPNSK